MIATTTKTPAALKKEKMLAVAKTVADHFGHSRAGLLRDGREQPRVFHRQIAIFLAVRVAEASYEEVARFFGKKDHQTCTYATRVILERIATNPEDAELVEQLRAKCTEALR